MFSYLRFVFVATLLVATSVVAQQPSARRDADQWFYSQRSYPSGIPEDAPARAIAQRRALETTVAPNRESRGARAANTWSPLGPAGVSGPEGIESGHVSAIV